MPIGTGEEGVRLERVMLAFEKVMLAIESVMLALQLGGENGEGCHGGAGGLTLVSLHETLFYSHLDLEGALTQIEV